MTTTTKPKTKSKSAVRKFVKPEWVDAPLSILYSCRVRLTDAERATFKAAYEERSRAEVPASKPAIGNSSVVTQTSYGASSTLERELGMSRLIAFDQLSTRESIPLTVILKFQQVLGIQVFTPDRLTEAFNNYIAYIFTKED